MGGLSDGAKKRSKEPRAVSPVRAVQSRENKRFAEECENHGCHGRDIAIPSAAVNTRTYGVTPSGKPDQWSEEDQKKQAIAKRKASESISAIGPNGTAEVTQVAGDAAREAKHLVNRHGTTTVWEHIFGKRSAPVEPLEVDDDSDDSPLIETRMDQIRRIEADKKAQLNESFDTEPDAEPDEKPFKFFIWF
jgi:hypothetical protein